jgi:hypothetical protein
MGWFGWEPLRSRDRPVGRTTPTDVHDAHRVRHSGQEGAVEAGNAVAETAGTITLALAISGYLACYVARTFTWDGPVEGGQGGGDGKA